MPPTNNQPAPPFGGYQQAPATQPVPSGGGSGLRSLLAIVLLTIAFIGALIFAFWAFGQMRDYKNNSDKKAAAAVAVAEKSQKEKLAAEFAEQEKCVAAICHGGWLAISAGVYSGVRVTGSPGIQDDLINAGAIWEDAPVVVDRHFVSSRKPDDLPQFTFAMIEVIARSSSR